MSDSPNSRKLLWALLAVCLVTTLATVAVIGFLVFRKRSPTALTSTPLEVIEEVVESVPIVFGHEFTSEESRKWGTHVPHGTQVLDNVTFFVDGGLRVAGLLAHKHPGALLGIPVRQRGTKIHLLQAAENVGSADAKIPGTIYGRLRFHFGNGQSRDTYLRYGVHGFDWFQVAKQLSNTVSDPNTADAWVEPRSDRKVFIRLHHTALENPFPNEEIMSFDVISPLARGMNIDFSTRAIRAIHYTATDQQGTTASGIIAPPDTGWSPTQEIAIVFRNKLL